MINNQFYYIWFNIKPSESWDTSWSDWKEICAGHDYIIQTPWIDNKRGESRLKKFLKDLGIKVVQYKDPGSNFFFITKDDVDLLRVIGTEVDDDHYINTNPSVEVFDLIYINRG